MVIPLLANQDLKPTLYQGVEEARSSKNWSYLEKRLAKNKKIRHQHCLHNTADQRHITHT